MRLAIVSGGLWGRRLESVSIHLQEHLPTCDEVNEME